MPAFSAVQRYPRFPADTPAELLLVATAELRCAHVVNISLGGLFANSSELLPVGSLVHVRLSNADFAAAAKVVHGLDAAAAMRKGHPAGMGLEFDGLGILARERLKHFVGNLQPGVAAPPPPAAPPALLHLRPFPRFSSANAVRISLESREALRALWDEELSRGRLFAESSRPPPSGAQVEIELCAPRGGLVLRAQVVQVIDAETAHRIQHPPGAGLELIDLKGPKQEAIERYLREETEVLRGPEMRRGAPLPLVLAETRRLLAGIEAGDLHGSLGLSPTCSAEQEQARILELKRLFSLTPEGATPPQAARVDAALRALSRVERQFATRWKTLPGELVVPQAKSEPEVWRAEPPPREVRGAPVSANVAQARDLAEQAEVYLGAGMMQKAKLTALQVATLWRSGDVARRALRVLVRTGGHKEALALAKELTSQDPSDVSAWQALLTVYEDNGHHALALRTAHTLLQLTPHDDRLKAKARKLKGLVGRA